MRRVTAAAALIAVGVAAPHVQAADEAAGIVAELRGIRGELASIRRAVEKR